MEVFVVFGPHIFQRESHLSGRQHLESPRIHVEVSPLAWLGWQSPDEEGGIPHGAVVYHHGLKEREGVREL